MSARRSSFLQLIRDPVRFFRDISSEAGPIAETRVGPRRFYIIRDPEVIRDLLMTQSDRFEKFPRINLRHSIFGKGLLTSENPAHKLQRRMLQPAFHRDLLPRYAAQMVACTEDAASEWTADSHIDVGRAMNRLALDIVARTLFSLEDFAIALELGHCVETMLAMVNHLVMPWGSLLMNLPLPASRRYRNAARRLDAMVHQIIVNARAADGREDMLSMLLATNKADGTPLSEPEIRDELVTMIVAGHETVANGLTWCLYLLAKHDEIQTSLARQITGAEDYSQLTFLEHAFAESLRLYPPIWILGRRALTDYQSNGFRAPKGSVFLVCMADLHRRPEFFADPELFEPERWLNPQWPAYAYIPFGGGNRRCIGERFAWMEGTLCLAILLRRWRFSLVESGAPETLARLTLQPRHPLLLRISARAASAAPDCSNHQNCQPSQRG